MGTLVRRNDRVVCWRKQKKTTLLGDGQQQKIVVGGGDGGDGGGVGGGNEFGEGEEGEGINSVWIFSY